MDLEGDPEGGMWGGGQVYSERDAQSCRMFLLPAIFHLLKVKCHWGGIEIALCWGCLTVLFQPRM